MKLLYFSMVLIAFVNCDQDVCINKLVDRQLLAIGNTLRKMHIKYVNVGNVSISEHIKAHNVKLGDVSRIKRKEDAYLWTGTNTINMTAAIGIDKLDFVMDTLQLNGKTYKKVLVVVYSNVLSFKTSVYSTKTACNLMLSGLRLSNVTGVMLYSRPYVKMNVTSTFQKQVVPFVNDRLSNESFVKFLTKLFDMCSENPSDSVADMIAKRFRESGASSSKEAKSTRETDQQPFDSDEVFIDYLLAKLEVRLKEKIDSILKTYQKNHSVDDNEENKRVEPPAVSLL